MFELPHNQPDQPPKQSLTKSHQQQTERQSGRDSSRRSSRVQDWTEHCRADSQRKNPGRKVSQPPAGTLSQLHRL